jgi:hypothetical protein
VDAGGYGQGDRHRKHQPVCQKSERGKLEYEETDVAAELGVGLSEGNAVQGELYLRPADGRRRAEENGQEHAAREKDQVDVGIQPVPELVDHLLQLNPQVVRRPRRGPGSHAPGDEDVAVEEDEARNAEGQTGGQLDPDPLPEHRLLSQLPEPQGVGDELRHFRGPTDH